MVLVLKKLKKLRSKARHQLYNSNITLVIDYSLVIQVSNINKNTLSKLNIIQKIATQAIIDGCKIVIFYIAKLEVNFQNMEEKFYYYKFKT